MKRVGTALLAAGLLSGLLPLAGHCADAGAAHSLLEDERAPVTPRYLLAGPGGRALTNEDFRGRYQLITFGYTFCPDVCPTTLAEMAAILRGLGDQARELQPIFVTLDPARDTGEVLAAYTAFFDPRILGLRGSPELTARAASNFRVRYAKVERPGADPRLYAIDHGAGMFLVAPDGSYLRKFGYGTPVDTIVNEINRLMGER